MQCIHICNIYVNRHAIESKRKQKKDKVNLKTRSYFL